MRTAGGCRYLFLTGLKPGLPARNQSKPLRGGQLPLGCRRRAAPASLTYWPSSSRKLTKRLPDIV